MCQWSFLSIRKDILGDINEEKKREKESVCLATNKMHCHERRKTGENRARKVMARVEASGVNMDRWKTKLDRVDTAAEARDGDACEWSKARSRATRRRQVSSWCTFVRVAGTAASLTARAQTTRSDINPERKCSDVDSLFAESDWNDQSWHSTPAEIDEASDEIVRLVFGHD